MLNYKGKLMEQRLFSDKISSDSNHRPVKVNNQVIIDCVRQCLDQEGIHNTTL